MFHGSIVALVTPMHKDGAIDFDSLEELVNWHIDSKTDGLVILGTTGESSTIHFDEREEIISKVIDWVGGRIPVIAGTGVNSTEETIHLTRHAMELGVDACLIVTPYYNKPTQEGLYQHFKTVAEEVAIPQIMYNVPSRTACDLLPETVGRLSGIPNIVGIKESTGIIDRVGQILDASEKALDLLTGEDKSALDFMLAGGKGVISVTANVAPKQMAQMCKTLLDGKEKEGRELFAQLMPLNENLFIESNPIPAKWALNYMKKIAEGIRLPLTVLSKNKQDAVIHALRESGIIK